MIITLGITFPSIYGMQVRAIISACCDLISQGHSVQPEIMIPLTSHVNEMSLLRQRLVQVADEVQSDRDTKVEYKFGTMIEVPRAALTADQVATAVGHLDAGTAVAQVSAAAEIGADVIALYHHINVVQARDSVEVIAGNDITLGIRSATDGVGGGLNADATLLSNVVGIIGRKGRTIGAQSNVVAGDGIAATKQQDAVVREVADGQATDCGAR